jgi:hypothetical protein
MMTDVITPPHSTTLHHTPPHSTTLHHTPPQKSGPIGLYITTSTTQKRKGTAI